MAVIESMKTSIGRVTAGARRSVARARLESEHRGLQRAHGEALRQLGARAQELVAHGELPDDALAPELAAVRAAEMLVVAKQAEIAECSDPEPPDPA